MNIDRKVKHIHLFHSFYMQGVPHVNGNYENNYIVLGLSGRELS